MKKYNKAELVFEDGYICTKDGDVINVHPAIIKQANELETKYQQFKYLDAQPKAQPMPTLDGFERESAFDIKPGFVAHTPILDKKCQDAFDLMKEIELTETAEKLNEIMDTFRELFLFAMNDYVYDCNFSEPWRFDTPLLGDPLKLTEDKLIDILAEVVGYETENV